MKKMICFVVLFLFIQTISLAHAITISNVTLSMSPPIGDAIATYDPNTGEMGTFARAGYAGDGSEGDWYYGEHSSADVVVTGDVSLTADDVLYLHFYHHGSVHGDGTYTLATGDMNFEMELNSSPGHFVWPPDTVFSVTSQFVADEGWNQSNTFQSSHGGKETIFWEDKPFEHDKWFFIQLTPGSHKFSYSMKSEAIYYEGKDPYGPSDIMFPLLAESLFTETGFALFTSELPVGLNPEDIVYITPDNPSGAIPEPGTMLLFSLGLLSLAGVSRKKQK